MIFYASVVLYTFYSYRSLKEQKLWYETYLLNLVVKLRFGAEELPRVIKFWLLTFSPASFLRFTVVYLILSPGSNSLLLPRQSFLYSVLCNFIFSYFSVLFPQFEGLSSPKPHIYSPLSFILLFAKWNLHSPSMFSLSKTFHKNPKQELFIHSLILYFLFSTWVKYLHH